MDNQELEPTKNDLIELEEFVRITRKRFDQLIACERDFNILNSGYKSIVDALFPQQTKDYFNREVDHDRILQEIKSWQTIHARSNKLNLLLGSTRRVLQDFKSSIDKILKEMEKF